MSEHTRGPWEMPTRPYRLNNSDDGENFSGGDWNIYPPLGEAGPVAIASTEADARLIAAAPALVKALERIRDENYCHNTIACDALALLDPTVEDVLGPRTLIDVSPDTIPLDDDGGRE